MYTSIKFSSIAVLMIMMLRESSGQQKPRHIVFIVADDLGWNDVGFHNPDIISPNIDKLARQGVILNSSYVQPVCTPSRHSFMSGVYPFKAGLQHGTISPGQPVCSPLSMQFFPEKLQKLGYSTHMIGKWHLGFCNLECTPTRRGFDSFLGFYSGMEDYYNKTRNNGIDFNDGIKAIPADNRYSTYIYAERAKQIIINHNETKPLFLYLPFQSVHAPIEVPKRFEDMYQHIVNDNRRKFSGMVSAMDEAIGNVTQALTDNGLIEDTLFIFTSDNSGWPIRGGNNYPLRGGKITIFEGGTRAASFVSGSGIEKNGSTYEGLIHAVDWHPTILSAAGSYVDNIDDSIDGLDQWNAISTGAKSARNEFVYNLDDSIDPTTGHAAIRVGDFKLISGYPGPYQGWYKPEQELKGASAGFNSTWSGDGLYNLKDDPTEHHDLSKEHPDVVINLKAKLDEYRKAYVKPNDPKNDDKADPKYHGGHWMPGWC
ncbi:arylsulfatase B-like [Ruditapes philippinarum]|uniref:arylsulfatase B-like n=1 Tax=Ruditapes philippinarum TaxID=129788 RepID=UPI00295A923E|nr:arylsulfatase B-like [Ruditapes philippinarum]XP_060588768.1 arylsulfatase B-like [Ruditapes philippinarum]